MLPWWPWAIAACWRSRAALAAENLCLREQLLVLRRRQLRPRLSDRDRRFWILASRWFPGWQDILVVVSAATVLCWHHRGWRAYWRWRSRRGAKAGRRPIAQEVQALIRRMAAENRSWGQRRIQAELARLGFKVWRRAEGLERSPCTNCHRKGRSSASRAKKIQHLVKLKSIGPEFATVLVGEVFYRTFDNRKQIGSYVGLTPSPFQSGSTSPDQGISRAGNAKARTTMIELAWLWLRNQPDSSLSVWFRERVGKRKGRIKRIAIVAMARKLLIALWRYLETGLVPEGTALKSK
jgi:Transposase IS116/IS110/IS902 family